MSKSLGDEGLQGMGELAMPGGGGKRDQTHRLRGNEVPFGATRRLGEVRSRGMSSRAGTARPTSLPRFHAGRRRGGLMPGPVPGKLVVGVPQENLLPI